jgi:hypothetical protein
MSRPRDWRRCTGWRGPSCPNIADWYRCWYYEGARAWPTWGYWCFDCLDLVDAFIAEHQPGTIVLEDRPLLRSELTTFGDAERRV